MNSVTELLTSVQKAFNKKEYDKAVTILNKVLEIDSSNADAYHTLGIIAFTTGNNKKAIEYFKQAVDLSPDNAHILFNYAAAIQESGSYADALKYFKKVLTLIPKHIPSLVRCSSIFGITGNPALAERTCRLILKLEPSNITALGNCANACKNQGRIEEAMTLYKQALDLEPHNYLLASNFLLCLNYSTYDQQSIFEEHKKWKERITLSAPLGYPFDSVTKTAHSKIRVGYVSADFRTHSVGYFIEPILKNHNKKHFEIYCYADIINPDNVTERLKKCVPYWRSIYKKNDEQIIQMIRDDEIDILVDLSGHSGDCHLSLFLYKPAPIQVTYLGYPNTTGLSEVDYRLTDELSDPQGSEQFYTEKLYRLPDGFLCYRPPDDIPPVAETPALQNSYITFGSFNNLPKINLDTIKVWSEILKAVPGSRLAIKTKPFNDQKVMDYYKDLFIKQEIEVDRLIFNGHSFSMEEHLNWYNRIDIALDTFPYNGATTTCEALLMGVPVITRAGNCHAGRVGKSILSRIGLSECIASDSAKYIERASCLADDVSRLSQLRKDLRNTLLQSSLCNGTSFTQTLEKAYKEMYENFRKLYS